VAATSSDKKNSSLDLMPFIERFGRAHDERFKTAVAIPAVPNVTDALIAPVLGPFGGYQLITALSALHPETGTFGYYRHGNLAAFASKATGSAKS
jgi:hypothetical protein